MRRHKRSVTQAERGNTLVEFALSFWVVCMCLFCTWQFGFAFYQYNRLESSVIGAVRYASRLKYDSGSATPTANFTRAVQNMAVYGNPDGTGSPVAHNLSTDRVQVDVRFASGVPAAVTVSLTRFPLDVGIAQYELNGKPQATYRYMGVFSPPPR